MLDACPTLRRLVADLDHLGGPAPRPHLEGLLRDGIPAAELAPWIAFDPAGRCRTLVHRTEAYEILVLGWLPGQASSIHEHGASACAFRVVEGRAWERLGPAGAQGEVLVHEAGAVVARGAGAWHVLGCEGDAPLVTVHVYAPPLAFAGVAPETRARRPHVAILGGGLAAAALAVRLARSDAADALAVSIVEPAPTIGRGLAYAAHPAHLLNVPADRMGLSADDPGAFYAWARARVPEARSDAFLPRNLFGDYVADTLRREVGWRARHVRARARDVVRVGERWEIALDDGTVMAADVVVLAAGNAAAAHPPGIPLEVRGDARYVGVPWSAEALAAIGPDEPVLVVGAGLTAVDVLVALRANGHRARVTLLSRRGLLPRPHAAPGAAPARIPALPEAGDLRAWLRSARLAAAAAVASGEPWQAVFDALRARVPAIWRGLDAADRARFLRHLRPWWDAHRHRVPVQIHAEIARLRAEGVVDVVAGTVVGAEARPDGVRVAIRRRGRGFAETLDVARVVNATGADLDLGRSGGALHTNLLARGLVRQDAHRVGLDVGTDGAALGADGRPVPGLFVLGGARRARDWECTAVPEIRAQAAELAEVLGERLGVGARAAAK